MRIWGCTNLDLNQPSVHLNTLLAHSPKRLDSILDLLRKQLLQLSCKTANPDTSTNELIALTVTGRVELTCHVMHRTRQETRSESVGDCL